MPRPSNTEQRRHEIIKAFLEVMATQGYAKATIAAIADKANLAPGLIHYHFKNKQEILLELIEQSSQLTMQRYQQNLVKAQSAKERLKAYIDARLAKSETDTSAFVAAWVVIGTEAIRQEEVRQAYEEALKKQQKIIEGLLEELTDKDKKSIKKMAGIIMAAIEGAFQLSVAAKNIMPQSYAAESLFELIENSLK
jgi:TetR/AcrR family transcriptional regulator, transcriptional repressor of bet genes